MKAKETGPREGARKRSPEANPRERARRAEAMVGLLEYKLARAQFIAGGLTAALAAAAGDAKLKDVQWHIAEACVKHYPITEEERAIDEIPF